MAVADLKDRQAQMRHTHPKVTAEVYDQFIPENQRNVVDKLGSFGTNLTKQKVSDFSQLVENMVAKDGVGLSRALWNQRDAVKPFVFVAH